MENNKTPWNSYGTSILPPLSFILFFFWGGGGVHPDRRQFVRPNPIYLLMVHTLLILKITVNEHTIECQWDFHMCGFPIFCVLNMVYIVEYNSMVPLEEYLNLKTSLFALIVNVMPIKGFLCDIVPFKNKVA